MCWARARGLTIQERCDGGVGPGGASTRARSRLGRISFSVTGASNPVCSEASQEDVRHAKATPDPQQSSSGQIERFSGSRRHADDAVLRGVGLSARSFVADQEVTRRSLGLTRIWPVPRCPSQLGTTRFPPASPMAPPWLFRRPQRRSQTVTPPGLSTNSMPRSWSSARMRSARAKSRLALAWRRCSTSASMPAADQTKLIVNLLPSYWRGRM